MDRFQISPFGIFLLGTEVRGTARLIIGVLDLTHAAVNPPPPAPGPTLNPCFVLVKAANKGPPPQVAPAFRVVAGIDWKCPIRVGTLAACLEAGKLLEMYHGA